MKDKITKVIVFLSFFLLFISISNKYLSIKLWDYDFWWHLATGKYIVENTALPDKDPFSFVSNLDENKNINPTREKLILKSYWLSQILFYKIYNGFNEKGIILLRSFILFLVVFFIFLWFRRQKVSFYIIFPFVFLVFSHTMKFTGERPVLFTVLFSVLIFFILDNFKHRKGKLIFFLIPLMLLWANMHGGFILGIVFIFAFIVGETLNYFIFKKGEINKKALMTLLIVGIIAIAFSAINPNGFDAFLTVTKQNKIFQAGVQEYYSPFYLYKYHVRLIDWEYIILLVFFPILALLRNKKIDIVYYLLLGGLLFMSVTALRFTIYYICIGTMISGRELHCLLEGYFRKGSVNKFKFELITSFLILISSLLFTFGFLNFDKITFAKATTLSVPKGAADFIESNNIQGNMYNDMAFGGYLIWRFYPQKTAFKAFIDTRQINFTVMKEHEMISLSTVSLYNSELPKDKKPLWERLLDHYEIDVIVIDTMDAFGWVRPITFSLIKSDKWIPVFTDLISVVFVRDKEENKELIEKYRVPEDVVYNMIIVRLINWATVNRKNPQYLISTGDVFFNMGRYDDALKAYLYADNRLPGKKRIKEKITVTKEKIGK
jgi:hypothetical protein